MKILAAFPVSRDIREYELICLPLKIEGADGAPARAVLRRLIREPGSGAPIRPEGAGAERAR